ncbi:hypothetical protein Gotri_011068 [Gossypium trilobum]|uniref:Carboxypeptidase n=3 Tax=Gossypium TaxID=3633 RepID=A0A7J9ETG4_9ROSI|nr:hypothetical protein [Gossypium davidsonii]MBA0660031.1 hypothetical protein [Gossypium klotzschianum]MBA0776004.1 hypothetical protein [Gossypium trilobum]
MAKPQLLFLFSFSLLCLISFSAADSSITADLRLTDSSFPSVHAKKLIRELNLFPKGEVNVVDEHRVSLPEGPKLVEKRFKFPTLEVPGGVSFEDLGHHAGYYKLPNSHDARMFYFFFESRNSKKDPVVIWLTGGPGCSSELALFYENGPFTIADNMSLVWNDYGWDKASNLLYVDQPIGTGFSYSSDQRDIRHNEDEVSNDLYDFLQAFFAEHPEFAKNDFFITGESYAGHYIPAFAARVHRGNKAKEGIHINLKASYTDYALDMGVIKKSDHDRINKLVPVCEMAIKLCGNFASERALSCLEHSLMLALLFQTYSLDIAVDSTDGTISCMASYFVCNNIFNGIMALAGDTNYYDVRKKCEGSLCYDFSNMESFLNKKSVRDALGVGNIDFVSCSPTVYQAMLVDWMRNLEVGIPVLLEDGIKLLVYAGEYDLICNWLGNSRWVHAMEWSGQKEFVASPEVPFIVDGAEAGVLKTHGALGFLKVHDAGHMVPMDQPKAALEMLKRWTKGTLSDASDSEKLVAEM